MHSQTNGDNTTEERRYFLSVLSTFESYKEQSMIRINRRERYLQSLPNDHRSWLTRYKEDLDAFKQGIYKNAEFIPIIVQHAYTIFDNVLCNDNPSHSETEVGTLSEGLDKVQSVFKQLMRDWSALGAAERQQCYVPIIEEVERYFPPEKYTLSEVNVLVPGAGLGRLAFEIASRGYSCQGNEFNLFMLIVSFYVLNLCKKVDEFTIYPWIHQYCNNLTADQQMMSVTFPDVRPMPTPESKFSMTAGDFLEVYTNPEEWDCVATCFFIDCAANVVQFIELIHHILKPGGIWVNLGPLLYHYSDIKYEKSIEPSFQVLCEVIEKVGFVMEKNQTGLKTRYCQNPMSMLQYEYNSVFFVCRKPERLSNDINKEGHVEN
ncbi:hypothetical protein RI129_003626 [Pyrocoelia pectoralis]|uniref:Carnosine N-methyltransferase n=1 Tax=Pyrocoelia pectoralis TaxID=417401 RepID=A0AAN7VRN3_9COLE